MRKYSGFTTIMRANCGFTLVELLITVSIIAILASIGISVYSSLQKNARDGKRQSDLRSIQSALEQYYADRFYYPPLNSSATCPIRMALQFGCPLKDSTGNKTYMNTIPNDSNMNSPYIYSALPASCSMAGPTMNNCTSYCLYAKMENVSSPAPPPSGCGTSYPEGGYNFVVTPP